MEASSLQDHLDVGGPQPHEQSDHGSGRSAVRDPGPHGFASTQRADEIQLPIREALQLSGGRVSEAAERLGMSRSTFWRRRRKHDL